MFKLLVIACLALMEFGITVTTPATLLKISGSIHLDITVHGKDCEKNCSSTDSSTDSSNDLSTGSNSSLTVLATNCADIKLKNPTVKSGVYQVDIVQGCDRNPKQIGCNVAVYCDMETLGGGWTVFQRRTDGSENFKRGWADYANGFGTVNNEFWLGNDNLNLMTNKEDQVLLVELREWDRNCSLFAMYGNFSVESSDTKYILRLGEYVSGTAGGSLDYHKNMKFSTIDQDNDNSGGDSCAQLRNGGWWYKDCQYANLNGLFSQQSCQDKKGYVSWYHAHEDYYSFPWTEMKFRPSTFRLANNENQWCQKRSCEIKCKFDRNC